MAETFRTDVVIFGGGIAGLWLFRRLRGEGFNPILIEKDFLGHGQTLAAQGIIHGGLKYSLEGILSDHTQSLGAMPQIWKDCLRGCGELNLTGAKVLADRQHLWSPGTIADNLVSFFASKVMSGKVLPLSKQQWPQALHGQGHRGNVYELLETVIDTKSVVKALAGDQLEAIYKSERIEVRLNGGCIRDVLLTSTHGDPLSLSADCYAFTAGIGNEFFAAQLGFRPDLTQRRPLRMLMVADAPAPLYGHCLGKSNKPRVTISTHLAGARWIWYLGGALAEKSAELTPNEAIDWGKREMGGIFPSVDWHSRDWRTFDIDRAEPRQTNNVLPNGPSIISRANAALAWPAKMVFAPGLAANVLTFLRQKNIKPAAQSPLLPLPKPEIGAYPWEHAF